MNPSTIRGRPASHRVDDVERDAAVQVPLLHGQRDHEAAEEEHDRAVEVDRRGVAPRHDAQKRVEDQREQRRWRKRGIASVTHHTAMSSATAARWLAASFPGSTGKTISSRKAVSPSQRPTVRPLELV